MEVGDKVKIVFPKMKEKYNNIYEIKKVKTDCKGIELYKIGNVPNWAIESMIELVKKLGEE